ncbi:glycosyltransferase family 9 protein [Anaeromusa sp.]|uniref:glycosyltransferase family 9 protein n=1 Tax=Anaeromusa sp. TaxID=1872520 RepID=UPI002624AB12|nr:glycosyltransferase family 9 protein [Anaeromusa sp.]MDD3157099.1 glycosyltransferase family 9 protein [Anaeromusa sp.]
MMNLETSFMQYLDKVIQEKNFVISDFVQTFEEVFWQNGFRTSVNCKKIFEILIVRDDEIGDVILTSGFLREVRRAYPQARITLVVKPSVFNLVEKCPYVNEFVVYDWEKMKRKNFASLYHEIIKLCRETLWDRKFDLFFSPRWEFDGNLPNLLGYVSGAKERVGYSEFSQAGKRRENSWDLLLTKSLTVPLWQCHDAVRIFFVLEALGHVVVDKSLEVWFDASDSEAADNLLSDFNLEEEETVIAVVPGAGHPRRQWEPSWYAALLKQIFLKEPRTRVIILGAPAERALGEVIYSALPQGAVLNAAGKTTLRQTAAILAKCHMYIGNDTGLMHMAAASGLPVLLPNCCAASVVRTIYTVPERVEPWQVQSVTIYPAKPLSPCGVKPTSHGCTADTAHCINQVTVQEMIKGWNVLRSYAGKNGESEDVKGSPVLRVAGRNFLAGKRAPKKDESNILGSVLPALRGVPLTSHISKTLKNVMLVVKKHNKFLALRSMEKLTKLCGEIHFYIVSSEDEGAFIAEQARGRFCCEFWQGLDEQEQVEFARLEKQRALSASEGSFVALLFDFNYYDLAVAKEIELFYRLGFQQLLVMDGCLEMRYIDPVAVWLSAQRLLWKHIEWYWITKARVEIASLTFVL